MLLAGLLSQTASNFENGPQYCSSVGVDTGQLQDLTTLAAEEVLGAGGLLRFVSLQSACATPCHDYPPQPVFYSAHSAHRAQ